MNKNMAPIYVERRRRALAITIGAPVLTLLGIFAGPKMVEEVADNFRGTECTGYQTFIAKPGDTFDGLSINVQYDNDRVAKDEIVSEIIDMNPSTKVGSIIVGQTVLLPIECHKA